jgi:glutamate/tyrosine decarboxylase-like PLP-dependent enzyme
MASMPVQFAQRFVIASGRAQRGQRGNPEKYLTWNKAMSKHKMSIIDFNKEELTQLLQSFAEDVSHFYESIREHPVTPSDLLQRIATLVEGPLSLQGLGIVNATTALKETILPGLAYTAGPRAFPWVIGGVTPAALIGAFYQILYDQINMVSGASIGPQLEKETIKLLLDLFNLPRASFDGLFTSGATASNICALAIARQWCGQKYGVDIATEGVDAIPSIQIYSAAPHASIAKALGILGIGRKNLILVPTLPNREAIDILALENALAQSTGKAKIVVASAGTVNSGDFDDIAKIRVLCDRYNAWLHVDAAFGLFAACSDEHKALLNGIESADSITVDGHKWLNVPYDCAMLFIKEEHKRHQVATFSSVANYMSLTADEPMNKGLENSRALRALPVWLALKAYGHQGYQELVKDNCAFASTAAELIVNTGLYELLAPVRLNIVLFKAKNIESVEENNQLLAEINKTGKIFMTSTVWAGKPALRIAVCNWQTSIDLDLGALGEALIVGMVKYKERRVKVSC